MIKANLYDTEFCQLVELNFQTEKQLQELLTLNPRFEVDDLSDIS